VSGLCFKMVYKAPIGTTCLVASIRELANTFQDNLTPSMSSNSSKFMMDKCSSGLDKRDENGEMEVINFRPRTKNQIVSKILIKSASIFKCDGLLPLDIDCRVCDRHPLRTV
jgi:hypothetical protein